MPTEPIKEEPVKDKPPKEKKSPFKQWGSASLTTPTKPVTAEYMKTEEFKQKVKKLFEMMEGVGWGLAANQIGWDKSVAAIEVKPVDKYPEWSVVPPTLIVNPEITASSKELQYSWEACLSCPETQMFFVPRPEWIEVNYLDENGKKISQKLSGLAATVFHHEIDHLNGRTCGERVMVVDGVVARGAIITPYEYRKNTKKIPVGAEGIVKPEQTMYGAGKRLNS